MRTARTTASDRLTPTGSPPDQKQKTHQSTDAPPSHPPCRQCPTGPAAASFSHEQKPWWPEVVAAVAPTWCGRAVQRLGATSRHARAGSTHRAVVRRALSVLPFDQVGIPPTPGKVGVIFSMFECYVTFTSHVVRTTDLIGPHLSTFPLPNDGHRPPFHQLRSPTPPVPRTPQTPLHPPRPSLPSLHLTSQRSPLLSWQPLLLHPSPHFPMQTTLHLALHLVPYPLLLSPCPPVHLPPVPRLLF